MAEIPLEADKTASAVNVGQPASGTYGEKTDLANLQKSLPASPGGPEAQQPPGPMSPSPVNAPTPQREGRPPTGAALPPGIPSPILAPTDMPHVPVSTPLSQATDLGASPTGAQQRLAILDALTQDPNVSKETKEWAQIQLRVLLGA